MRAPLFVLATTVCACRPEVATTTAHDPAAAQVRVRLSYAPTDPQAPPPRPAASSVVATPTPASECFAEPVTYHRKMKVEPMAAEAEERLLRCDAPAGDNARACRFRVARAYFDAGRFERAGPLLLAIAHDATSADAALAAQLAFESMNMLGIMAVPNRPACGDLMVEELPKLLRELCTPEPRPGAERVCAMLHIIDVDLVKCSECTQPTVTGRSRQAAYASAGRLYFDLANRQCVFGKGRQARNDELRCDDLLYRAHAALSQANDPGRAAQARALLLDPKNGLRQSEGAKRLLEIEARQREARRFREQFGRP